MIATRRLVWTVLLSFAAIAGHASAQEETDPFEEAGDPFAEIEDPFAALEANVSEAQQTLGATLEDVSSAATGGEEEEETGPAPTPAPAASEPAPKADGGVSKDTPGLGLAALVGAFALAAFVINRKR